MVLVVQPVGGVQVPGPVLSLVAGQHTAIAPLWCAWGGGGGAGE